MKITKKNNTYTLSFNYNGEYISVFGYSFKTVIDRAFRKIAIIRSVNACK